MRAAWSRALLLTLALVLLAGPAARAQSAPTPSVQLLSTRQGYDGLPATPAVLASFP